MNRSKRAIVLFAVLSLLSLAAVADDGNVCPCIPRSDHWIATACDTWACATSALTLAEGDPSVMLLPFNSVHYKWLVLRHVVGGDAGAASPDSPIRVEQFASVPVATSQFSTMDIGIAPMMLTTTDGKVLLLSLREPEQHRRAAAR